MCVFAVRNTIGKANWHPLNEPETFHNQFMPTENKNQNCLGEAHQK